MVEGRWIAIKLNQNLKFKIWEKRYFEFDGSPSTLYQYPTSN